MSRAPRLPREYDAAARLRAAAAARTHDHQPSPTRIIGTSSIAAPSSTSTRRASAPTFPTTRSRPASSTPPRGFSMSHSSRSRTPSVWDPSVDTFDVYDAAPGNRASSSAASISTCIRARARTSGSPPRPSFPASAASQLPEGMLVCNFSGGKARRSRAHAVRRGRRSSSTSSATSCITSSAARVSGPARAASTSRAISSSPPRRCSKRCSTTRRSSQSFGKHYQTGEIFPQPSSRK